MAETTGIEWCDSTLNLQMGCDGCELWNPAAGVKHCYAGSLTERYAGKKGWPEAFEKPTLFLERLDKALRWPDLSGRTRPGNPPLNGLPRIVFLNDMGDTFTESLPLDWLAPALPRMAASPHQWLILTKRPKRMAEFSATHRLPPNVWPGASVTSAVNLGRVADLLGVRGGGPKWLSVEPMLGPVDLTRIRCTHDPANTFDCLDEYDADPICRREKNEKVAWVVVGGESGHGARPFVMDWGLSVLQQCKAAGVPAFMKQVGSNPMIADGISARGVTTSVWGPIKDPKGGTMDEWPLDLRVREFPEAAP